MILNSLLTQFEVGSDGYGYIFSLTDPEQSGVRRPNQIMRQLIKRFPAEDLVKVLGKTVATRGKTLGELVAERKVWNSIQGAQTPLATTERAINTKIHGLKEIGVGSEDVAGKVVDALPHQQKRALIMDARPGLKEEMTAAKKQHPSGTEHITGSLEKRN